MRPALRSIPSVDRVVRELGDVAMPRAAVVAVVRRELAAVRAQKRAIELPRVHDRVRAAIDALRAGKIRPLINGTGIIVHTNFGRSPLADEALAALQRIGGGYNNLEYDLPAGKRGGRGHYLEHNLAVLCGARAATVVNNCAAALVLIARHFIALKPDRTEVVISRGELVQIGGGFRVPEILEASGAVLREVGTTNKTTLSDYSRAIGKKTAMVLKVHRSNFFMGGFVESPTTREIAEAAHAAKAVFVEDLGSGAASELEIATGRDIAITGEESGSSEYLRTGVGARESMSGAPDREPTPAEVIAKGADLVCFSGDKLLGGPQAGIIAGRAKLVAALKAEPFFRALRCDKLILAALQETVDLHLNQQAGRIPALAMMRTPVSELAARAHRLAEMLQGLPLDVTVGKGKAQVGGGALPRTVIPSVTLDLRPRSLSLEELARRLREGQTPVVGYISGGRFKLDLRTIFVREDDALLEALRTAFINSRGTP